MLIIWGPVEYIKRGPLATRITTWSGYLSLYYCWSEFFVFNSWLQRKEFGLPTRDRNMAEDYKLDPVLGDNTNYIDWCKQLDVWVKITELTEEKKAVAIFLR